ncbi:polysaccharide biosynthesis tyrosine autokinase [Methylocaldum sp. RMAD-M]|jgi:tyrosine-protein kinase Etk/Wzc|uniref:polysaccharide biosynthesis tyrosine autokinase n=1 Tax=Methylocaldum sp. RMAD-M TaxID=2806557 RepID=UPI000A327DB0|nr:polysaccharide biosynthesis tyrosine autokinase [Methylocaldum sp. RMAD-M]MBP1152831.1 tyrosine-protein kinase Etk/Wzc [Methylocaldum sp. RMAD-M]
MSEYIQEQIEAPGHYRQPFGDYRKEADEGGDFPKFGHVLWDGKWLLAAIVLCSILVGEAYYFIATPVYKTNALVQVEKNAKSLATGLSEFASQSDGGGEASTSAEIEILQSRMVLGKVVEELHLDLEAKPKYFPFLGEAVARHYRSQEDAVSEPWFNLSGYAWGGEKIKVEKLIVPDGLLGASLTLVAGKESRFMLLDAEEDVLLEGKVGQGAERDMGEGQYLRLFVSYLKARPGTRFVLRRIPGLAATNALRGSFSVKEKGGSGMLELALSGSDRIAVENTLNAIADNYLRQNVEHHSEEAEKRLVFLEEQLPLMKERLEASERAYNAHRQRLGAVDIQFETQSLLNQIVNLESELRLLELQKGELQRKFTRTHPRFTELDGQIKQRQADLDALNKKTTELPDTQQELLRFERDVRVSTELYTSMLNSLQELRIAKAGTLGSVRIIDHALPPLGPESPQQAHVRTLSLIGGLFLGVVMVFVRNAFRAVLDDPDQVEKALALPVYANIPHCKEQNRLIKKHWGRKDKVLQKTEVSVLVAHEEKGALVLESLRSLRTALHFAMLNTGRNSLLITGPRPGVGKTFLSANLAAVFTQSGKRVLIIDADMRRGHLHRYFGVVPNQGLSGYISKDLEIDTVIQPTLVDGLDIIPTGTYPPNPSELLMHERFAYLLKQVENQYELVLVDSPPVLSATDAVIVGHLAAATLMVVRSGLHPMRELQDAAKRLIRNEVNLRGIIFNDVPVVARGYGYGNGKYAYYAYKYDRSVA